MYEGFQPADKEDSMFGLALQIVLGIYQHYIAELRAPCSYILFPERQRIKMHIFVCVKIRLFTSFIFSKPWRITGIH